MLVNEAYEAWKQAPQEQKQERLNELYKAVYSYAVRLIWKLKGEYLPDLATEIAEDVVMQRRSFDGRAKFSTWVGAIIQRHWADHIKVVIATRERFIQQRPSTDDDVEEFEVDGYFGEVEAWPRQIETIDNSLAVDQLESKIPERDKKLYRSVFREGQTQAAVAEGLGLSIDAVESRYRRLINSLRDAVSRTRPREVTDFTPSGRLIERTEHLDDGVPTTPSQGTGATPTEEPDAAMDSP